MALRGAYRFQGAFFSSTENQSAFTVSWKLLGDDGELKLFCLLAGGAELHLRYGGALLCSGGSPRQHGDAAGRPAQRSAVEAHSEVLPAALRQCARKGGPEAMYTRPAAQPSLHHLPGRRPYNHCVSVSTSCALQALSS